MSTKVTINHRARTSTLPGFHVYEDAMHDLGDPSGLPESPVFLRMEGVAVQLETLGEGGASVTVCMPRHAARQLRLLGLADTVGTPSKR